MKRHLPLQLALLGLLSACGAPGGAGLSWDGRRGYGGSGDYGYDLNASRAEARSYRALASTNGYAVPGPPEDPWGPHISAAAARFGVPERWIREVMRQESGGRLYAGDGSLITSSTGAMGLMQVMPATYDRLRARHGLGADPYEPRDNILAGAAYLRDMYDRFGSPYFLAAYNAGPQRVELYLAGAKILPDETENYVARILPRLGAGGLADPLPASAPMPPAPAYAAAVADPSDRAFEGGGLVTALAPTGQLQGLPYPELAMAPAGAPVAAAAAETVPAYSPAYSPAGSWPSAALNTAADWGIQVGAVADPAQAQSMAQGAQARLPGLLQGSRAEVSRSPSPTPLYRARLLGLPADAAAMACASLTGQGLPCFTVPPPRS
jgi:hypothetical protein